MADGKENRGGARIETRSSAFDLGPSLNAGQGSRNATDAVIARINALIRDKVLSPGDRLPAEISFARELGVSRSVVSKAYSKLEAYGLIRTVPQSGTYLASIGGDALAVLMTNVMNTDFLMVDVADIELLYMFRAFLEEAAAVPLAKTATESDLQELAATAKSVKTRILEQNGTIEDDLLFHLKIAELSGRPIFKSILLFIASPMVQVFRRIEQLGRTEEMHQRWIQSMGEHDEIVAAIMSRDEDRIRTAIRTHCSTSVAFRAKMMRKQPEAAPVVATV